MYDPQWAERNAVNAVLLDDVYGAYYHITGQYDKAILHLERMMKHYQNTNNFTSELKIKNRMARTYFAKGDYRAAAELYRQNTEGKDSINIERFYAQTGELRTIYETDKAEMEVVRRQAEGGRKAAACQPRHGDCLRADGAHGGGALSFLPAKTNRLSRISQSDTTVG